MKNHFKKNFQIGKLTLPNNILYAPMCGFSDFAFRKIASKFSPGILFCEMVKMEAVNRKINKTVEMLKYDSSMHPIGAQIFGAEIKNIKESAKIIEDMGFDLIDLNCGCPVRKVFNNGSGSALLKNPELIAEMISQMKTVVNIPVTIKVRIGINDSTINILELVEKADKAQADAITIHGRTKQQGYSGDVRLEYIKESKKLAKHAKIIGNGNIFSIADAGKMFEDTGCDGIMIARGMLSAPWFVEDCALYLNNIENYIDRSFHFKKGVFLEHLVLIKQLYPEKKAILEMKKISAWYLKNVNNVKKTRIQVYNAKETDEILRYIEGFSE